MAAFLAQFGRYRSSIFWIVAYVWRRFRGQLLAVLIGQWLGLGASAISIMLLLSLVRRLESGESVELFDVPFPIADEGFTVVLIGLILCSMLTGVVLLYLAKRRAVMLASSFSLACASDVAKGYGFLPVSSTVYVDERRLQSALVRLMNADPRHAGMALRRLIDAKLAILVLIGGAGVLFYLNWIATVIVLLGAGLVMPFYYMVNQNAVKASRRYEELAGLGRQNCLQILEQNRRVPISIMPAWNEGSSEFTALKGLNEAHRDRFVALTQSELVSRLLTAVAVCILAWGLSYFAQAGDIPWFLVIGYLLILRFVMLAVKQINLALTSVSRFYPSLFRLTQYFYVRDSKPACFDKDLSFRARRRTLLEKHRRLALRPGRPLNLFLPINLSCFSMVFLGQSLGLRKPAHLKEFLCNAMLVADRQLSSPMSLRIAVGASESTDGEALASLCGMTLSELEARLGARFNTSVSPELIGNLGEELTARLRLAAAVLHQGRSVIVIDRDSPGMDKAFKAMKEVFREHQVLLCTRRHPGSQRQSPVNPTVVIAADASVIGIGSWAWVGNNWKAISAAKRRIDKALLAANAVQGQEDFFEEE